MLEILNDEEISDEYVLSKMMRYNHRLRNHEESVSTHSFFVALFCLKIMSQLDLTVEEQNKVMIFALLHDVAESRTSDIPHDVKENYPAIKSMLDDIEKEYYEKHWKNFSDIMYNSGDLVYNIIKLADAYSVRQFCLDEFGLGTSTDEMKEIMQEATQRIHQRTNIINNIMTKRGYC